MAENVSQGHGHAPLPPSEEPDIAALVARAKDDLRIWIEAQKTYVGAEISARVELAMQPAISFGAAALIAFLASIALTMAVGFGLGELVGIPLGFLAAGVLYLGLAYLLFLWGKSRMRRMKRIQVSRRDARPDADWAPES